MANDTLQVREWFSRFLKNEPGNSGMTVAKRRKKAEGQLPKILSNQLHGDEWDIFKVFWQAPRPKKTKHRMTVLLKEKPNHPPTEATLPPKPATPPPSM